MKFGFLHHTMYTGIILAAFGNLLLYATWTTLFLACFAPLIRVRAQREEAALANEYGEQWQASCKHVLIWIPCLSRRKIHDQ